MTVLLTVEDSIITRRIISRALRLEGYDILEAVNGWEGLAMAATHTPTCILLDLLMPDLSGREVLQTLRDRHSTTPVIVITADSQHTSCQDCMTLGAFAVLNKPLNPEKLRHVVRAAIRSTSNINDRAYLFL